MWMAGSGKPADADRTSPHPSPKIPDLIFVGTEIERTRRTHVAFQIQGWGNLPCATRVFGRTVFAKVEVRFGGIAKDRIGKERMVPRHALAVAAPEEVVRELHVVERTVYAVEGFVVRRDEDVVEHADVATGRHTELPVVHDGTAIAHGVVDKIHVVAGVAVHAAPAIVVAEIALDEQAAVIHPVG